MKKVEVAIIGGGSSGLTAYHEIKKTGRTALLINDGEDGTTCARVGCMPSKAFIQIAQDFSKSNSFAERGIDQSEQLKVNFPRLMEHVRNLRDHFVKGIVKEVKQLEEDYLKGQAKFLSLHKLEVNHEIIEAEQIIIATGSRPHIPDEWKAFSSFFLTSDNFFELTEPPQSLAILGLGSVGLEIGYALSQLGSKVTGFCQNKFIGGLTDPEVNDAAIKIIEKNFPIMLNEKIHLSTENGKLVITHKNKKYFFDKALVATGRTPNLEHLDLHKLPLSFNKKNIPLFDSHTMKIKGTQIFLAGDATSEKAVLPEAIDEGFIAGYNASHKEEVFERRTNLHITFTDPTISIIGKNFASLEKENFICGKTCFENQGRAVIMARNKGIIKIYGEPTTGQIIGAEIICPEGEHIAHLLGFCIQQKLTVAEAMKLPFYHPVLEEGLLSAFHNMLSNVIASAHDTNKRLNILENEKNENLHKNIHTSTSKDFINVLSLGLATPSLDISTADLRQDSLQNIMRVLVHQKFPANKKDLIAYAQNKDEGQEIIEIIKKLPEEYFTDISAVISSVQKIKIISTEFPE